jgi:hypothetical protein
MSNLTVKPHAQSFQGIVTVPKAEIEDRLEQHYQSIRSNIPKAARKGFRPSIPERRQWEVQEGLTAAYGPIWRNIFIQSLIAEHAISYVDAVFTEDRGVHYEIAGTFYMMPKSSLDPNFVLAIRDGGSAWVKDQHVNQQSVDRAIDAVVMKEATTTIAPNAPIQRGDRIRIEVDSDVNKGYGGTPQRAMWELSPGKLPGDMIDCLVGKQVGHMVILPLRNPLNTGGPAARMTVRIIEHLAITRPSLDEVAGMEGLVNADALRTREIANIESMWEKNKINLLFSMLSQTCKMGPIPGPFQYDLATMRKQDMGEATFKKRFGTDSEAIDRMFLNFAVHESAELFLSWGLCQALGCLPTEAQLDHYMECEKYGDDHDFRLFGALVLAKEEILRRCLGVEPAMRSTLELPKGGVVRANLKIVKR